MNDDPSKAASKAAPISAVIPMKATLIAARKSAMKAAPGTRAVGKKAPVTRAGRKNSQYWYELFMLQSSTTICTPFKETRKKPKQTCRKFPSISAKSAKKLKMSNNGDGELNSELRFLN
jgi:hypothetical protein